jgi:GAF domain-containing protein
MNDRISIPQSLPVGSGNTQRYAWYGALFGLAFPVVAFGISLAVNRLPLSFAAVLALHVNQPILWIIDTAPFVLGAFASLAGVRQDAVERLNLQLQDQARDLASAGRSLERRVEQRTFELDERNRQLRQAVQVTRRISRIRDTAELAQSAVQSIAESYSDFVVDLYLIDERRAELVQTASSEGTAPEELAGRTIKVGDASMIGQVGSSGEVGRSLSGPRGPELALPLLSRGLPVGVLHVHPAHEGVALPTDTEVLQLMADQLASAIETARSFREASQALEQLRSLSGEAVQTAWRQGLPGETLVYEYSPSGTRAARAASLVADPSGLRIPLELRGQRIGTIAITRSSTDTWTVADRDLAEKTAAQVALALENVRLLEETRERAQTEQRLSEFSARLNQSVNLDTLLQTAVREFAGMPEVAGASIFLRPETMPGEQVAPQDRTRE